MAEVAGRVHKEGIANNRCSSTWWAFERRGEILYRMVCLRGSCDEFRLRARQDSVVALQGLVCRYRNAALPAVTLPLSILAVQLVSLVIPNLQRFGNLTTIGSILVLFAFGLISATSQSILLRRFKQQVALPDSRCWLSSTSLV